MNRKPWSAPGSRQVLEHRGRLANTRMALGADHGDLPARSSPQAGVYRGRMQVAQVQSRRCSRSVSIELGDNGGDEHRGRATGQPGPVRRPPSEAGPRAGARRLGSRSQRSTRVAEYQCGGLSVARGGSPQNPSAGLQVGTAIPVPVPRRSRGSGPKSLHARRRCGDMPPQVLA